MSLPSLYKYKVTQAFAFAVVGRRCLFMLRCKRTILVGVDKKSEEDTSRLAQKNCKHRFIGQARGGGFQPALGPRSSWLHARSEVSFFFPLILPT